MESVQALWDELFGARPEETPVTDELTAEQAPVVKKASRKRAAKTAAKSRRKTTESAVKKARASSKTGTGTDSKPSKVVKKKSGK